MWFSFFLHSDQSWWLGQHETNFSFGRFRLDHTKPVSYILPFSLEDEEVNTNQQEIACSTTNSRKSPEEINSKMAPHSFENKENVLYGTLYISLKKFSIFKQVIYNYRHYTKTANFLKTDLSRSVYSEQGKKTYCSK